MTKCVHGAGNGCLLKLIKGERKMENTNMNELNKNNALLKLRSYILSMKTQDDLNGAIGGCAIFKGTRETKTIFTIVSIEVEMQNNVMLSSTGIARKSRQDTFNDMMGFNIALGRAKKVLVNKIDKMLQPDKQIKRYRHLLAG